MPNHVTSVITVTGPEHELVEFESAHIVPESDGGKFFSLNTIIPMPEILRGTTSGTYEHLGLHILTARTTHVGLGMWESWFPLEFKQMSPYQQSREALRWATKNHPEWIEAGKRAARAIAETGYSDWYEWSVANWGTKWDAYDYSQRLRELGKLVIQFDTAWSFPAPCFNKLRDMYPALQFRVACFDEGHNFAGRGTWGVDYEESRELAEDEGLHREVYGQGFERDDLDDGRGDD